MRRRLMAGIEETQRPWSLNFAKTVAVVLHFPPWKKKTKNKQETRNKKTNRGIRGSGNVAQYCNCDHLKIDNMRRRDILCCMQIQCNYATFTMQILPAHKIQLKYHLSIAFLFFILVRNIFRWGLFVSCLSTSRCNTSHKHLCCCILKVRIIRIMLFSCGGCFWFDLFSSTCCF